MEIKKKTKKSKVVAFTPTEAEKLEKWRTSRNNRGELKKPGGKKRTKD